MKSRKSTKLPRGAPLARGKDTWTLMEITATISSFLTYVRVEKGLSPNTGYPRIVAIS